MKGKFVECLIGVDFLIDKPIPVAVRSKASVCSCLIAGNTGSNPAEGMDDPLLCSLCVVQVAASAMS